MSDAPALTVYWRPGCGFCAGLFRALDRQGLEYERRDIWEDEAAAAFVREVADGSETVPTVDVAGEVALVNPSAADVVAALAEHRPDALPEGVEPDEPGAASRLLGRLLGG